MTRYTRHRDMYCARQCIHQPLYMRVCRACRDNARQHRFPQAAAASTIACNSLRVQSMACGSPPSFIMAPVTMYFMKLGAMCYIVPTDFKCVLRTVKLPIYGAKLCVARRARTVTCAGEYVVRSNCETSIKKTHGYSALPQWAMPQSRRNVYPFRR